MSLFLNLKYSSNDVPVLQISGDLDITSVSRLSQATSALIEEGYSEIVLAMQDVNYMDSSGLRALLETRRVLQDKGGKLHIMDPSPRVLRVLSITKLLNSFSIVSPDAI